MKRFILLCALWPAMLTLPSSAVSRPRLMPACTIDATAAFVFYASAAFVFDATPEPGNSLGQEAPVP
jgi:hypothetical protein